MIEHWAYLCAVLDIRATFPQLIQFEIYSCEPSGLCMEWNKYSVVEIKRVKGDSYQDARDKMIDTIDTDYYLRWVKTSPLNKLRKS